MNLESIFEGAFLNGLTIDSNIKRQHVKIKWLVPLLESSGFKFDALIKFLTLNRRLFSAKEINKIIIYTLTEGYKTKEMLELLFSSPFMGSILACSSLTKLELLLVLKNVSYKSFDNYKKATMIDYLRKNVLHDGYLLTINITHLLLLFYSSLLTENSEEELVVSLAEMYMNNFSREMSNYSSTYCFDYLNMIDNFIQKEKTKIRCYRALLKVINRFKTKWYLESCVIPLIANIHILDYQDILNLTIKLPSECQTYLKRLLTDEPDFDKIITSRLKFIKNKLSMNITFLTTLNERMLADKLTKEYNVIDYEKLYNLSAKLKYMKDILSSDEYDDFVWNIPSLTFVDEKDVSRLIKNSYCGTLRLSVQGLKELYETDYKTKTKTIKIFESYDKNILVKKIKAVENVYVLNNEGFNSFWGYKCQDEYTEDCQNKTKCNPVLGLDKNILIRDLNAKCYLKRVYYQYGKISEDLVSEEVKKHLIQIEQVKNMIKYCNEVIFDLQTNG